MSSEAVLLTAEGQHQDTVEAESRIQLPISLASSLAESFAGYGTESLGDLAAVPQRD